VIEIGVIGQNLLDAYKAQQPEQKDVQA